MRKRVMPRPSRPERKLQGRTSGIARLRGQSATDGNRLCQWQGRDRGGLGCLLLLDHAASKGGFQRLLASGRYRGSRRGRPARFASRDHLIGRLSRLRPGRSSTQVVLGKNPRYLSEPLLPTGAGSCQRKLHVPDQWGTARVNVHTSPRRSLHGDPGRLPSKREGVRRAEIGGGSGCSEPGCVATQVGYQFSYPPWADQSHAG